MRSILLGAAVTALAIAPAQAQVFKCQEGGRTVYSQEPCGRSAATLDIKRHTPRPGSFEAAQARRDEYIRAHPGMPDLTKIAISAGVVTPGMTEAQALASMGPPDGRNLTQTMRTSRWQWVYRRGSAKAQYVYIEDGVVVGTN